jgi:tRNA pseudouridine38-40 synthase
MRFCLLIEYNGSAYNGWQIQNCQATIQGEIEDALRQIFATHIGIVGAGRTDAGVHAKGQVAHFDIEGKMDAGRLLRSLNGILKADIRIKEISPAEPDFHARFSAIEREYHYFIAPYPTALCREYTWHLTYDLNLESMNKSAGYILGSKNFMSFCRAKSDVNNYTCNVKEAKWLMKDGFILFRIRADRFLHGMVRALVGTFVDIGRGKLTKSDLEEIMKGMKRSLASQSAPARGLILEKVYY